MINYVIREFRLKIVGIIVNYLVLINAIKKVIHYLNYKDREVCSRILQY